MWSDKTPDDLWLSSHLKFNEVYQGQRNKSRIFAHEHKMHFSLFCTSQALDNVNRSKATYERTAKDIKVKHTAQKDKVMKTVIEHINKVLEEKITEVHQVYDPACQKLSVQAQIITNYLEKVEKSFHRTNEVLKNSKLQELMTAEKMLDDDIQMLQNERPQNLTSFQAQVDNPGSCAEKLCFYITFNNLAGNCEYLQLFRLRLCF